MVEKSQDEGLAWQVGVWNRMAPVYQQEIDKRFGPVVEAVLDRADLRPWQAVLDLGTGTGAVAFAAASQVGAGGRVTAVDISPEMLATARAGAEARALTNIDFAEGRGEAIPVSSHSQDAVLASLSLMYVIDRAATAKEVARVLRSSGRFIGAVWAGPIRRTSCSFSNWPGALHRSHRWKALARARWPIPRPFLNNCQTPVWRLMWKQRRQAFTLRTSPRRGRRWRLSQRRRWSR